VTWLQSYPSAGGRWDLVSTHARRRGLLTSHLVNELKKAGASPQLISGAWMVREADWLEHEAKFAAPAPAPAASAPTPPTAPAPSDIAEKLTAQAREIEQLQRQVQQLLEART
jgi:hypothetical protein